MISIVIPVLNEERAIETLLDSIARLRGKKEVIVADGGSMDDTRRRACQRGTLVDCPRGRGIQCNTGARRARGDILFFPHADSCLQPDALVKIRQAVSLGAHWGCLKLRFDVTHPITAIIAWCSNLRVPSRGIVFGDQGIFMTQRLFRRLGGFPELPLMEDYQLSLTLREMKIPPVQIDSYIVSSPRRFAAGGHLRTLWQMRRLRRLYRSGTDISVIQALYKDTR